MEFMDTEHSPKPSGNGHAPSREVAEAPPTLATLPPLVPTGLVLSKANLLAVLRLWIPSATDFAPLGEERFLVEMGPAQPAEPQGEEASDGSRN